MQVYEKQRKSTITQRVLDYAQAEGIGFEELSSVMGLSSLDISSLYRGKRTLMAEEYVLLCDLLGVPPLMFM